MFRLHTHANEAGGEVRKSGQTGEEAQSQCGLNRSGIAKDPVENAVREDLHTLCLVNRSLTVPLDLLEVFGGEVACAKRFAEQARSGDSILNGDVDTDAAYRGHGVGGVSDAEQAGKGPALKVVDLNG
jgi:hypothetical protein